MSNPRISFEEVPQGQTVVGLSGGKAWFLLVNGEKVNQGKINASITFEVDPDDLVMVYSVEGAEAFLFEYALRQSWGPVFPGVRQDISRAMALIMNLGLDEETFRTKILTQFSIDQYPSAMPLSTNDVIERLELFVEEGQVQTMDFKICPCCEGAPVHGHIMDHSGTSTAHAYDCLERMLWHAECTMRRNVKNPKKHPEYTRIFSRLMLEAIRSAMHSGLPSRLQMYLATRALKESEPYLEAVRQHFSEWVAAGTSGRFPVYTLCVRRTPKVYEVPEPSVAYSDYF